MKVHETAPHGLASLEEEGKVGARKQKGQGKGQEAGQPASKNKKAKVNEDDKGKSTADFAGEFDEFCKVIREHLSVIQIRMILEANEQDSSGSDDAVVPRCQDFMYYGALERCPYCNNQVEFTGSKYECQGVYNEWTTCPYSTRNPLRKARNLKIPDEIQDAMVTDWAKLQGPRPHPNPELDPDEKALAGMTIALSGRLSRTHQEWREEIEKLGGKVSNTVSGATCLVVSLAEREMGGSIKIVEAIEKGIPVVREDWLINSIREKERQPFEPYDALSDLLPEEILGKRDPTVEEIKLFGKSGVHKDSKLQEQGGSILEKNGILFNCALSLCDNAIYLNEYCIMQLITVPENRLYLFYKKERGGDDPRAEDRLEGWSNADDAAKEFARLFEELTGGNKFELWEGQKKFEKKYLKFNPVDMGDGVDVRHGGLTPRQLGVAVAHSKLEPHVANCMKVLCSQAIYKHALLEMGLEIPDMPMGMLSDFHLNACEKVLLKFREDLRSTTNTDVIKRDLLWLEFSNKWFTLMHSTRPFIMSNFEELADHGAATFEMVRDIKVASRLLGDMSGGTIDDPLFDRYRKLGCSMSPLGKESEDYKMIVKYLERTYEPVKFGNASYGISVDNVLAVDSSACPSYDDVKLLPNKMLLWCGTRTSNLIRHLHKGFLPAICSIPAPGYMFGRAIVCSDAAAEAARYGFTSVNRVEGFLALAVASMGDQFLEISKAPEDTRPLEEKKMGVKGLGRKKPDENEHFIWKDNIKVPCGRLVPSGHVDSPLEYNEYAVYDPKQVSIRFLVGVRYEERKRKKVDTAK